MLKKVKTAYVAEKLKIWFQKHFKSSKIFKFWKVFLFFVSVYLSPLFDNLIGKHILFLADYFRLGKYFL